MLPTVVQADQYGDFIYAIDGTNATITGYTGGGGVVSIPESILELRVASIGDSAFHNITSLTCVTVPDSVTNIGDFAFAHCGLTNVSIGNGVTSIGDDAFYNCASLGNVVIPNSVIWMGVDVFYYCRGLTNAVIGTNVVSIGDYAFGNCIGLRSVNIPNSVTNIGDQAFYRCTSLTSLVIGENVRELGVGAFSSCTKLTSVYFTGDQPLFAADVFLGDNSLTVYFRDGTIGWTSTFAGRSSTRWPEVEFQRQGNSLVLTWSQGTLQETTSLKSGQWLGTPGARSPYTVDASGPQKFYSLKLN